jgi:hypothetical protein
MDGEGVPAAINDVLVKLFMVPAHISDGQTVVLGNSIVPLWVRNSLITKIVPLNSVNRAC